MAAAAASRIAHVTAPRVGRVSSLQSPRNCPWMVSQTLPSRTAASFSLPTRRSFLKASSGEDALATSEVKACQAWDPLRISTEVANCGVEPCLEAPQVAATTNPTKERLDGDSNPLPRLLILAAGLPFATGLDLSGPGSVLEALGVLALIVGVHEAGHFLAARSLGIHVTKFAIGFGPTIIKYQANADVAATPSAPAPPLVKPRPQWAERLRASFNRSKAAASSAASRKPATPAAAPGVEYSLRLFPLGGYVAFPDEDENNTTFAKDDPNLLKNRPLLDRIIVVSAGVIANLIFAYAVLFTQVNTVGLLVQQFQPGVQVPKVIAGGAGEKGGLRDGDIILEVQGRRLPASEYSVSELVSIIKDQPNKAVEVVVARDDATTKLVLRPQVALDGSGRINVQLSPNLQVSSLRAKNPVDGAYLAGLEVVRLSTLVADGLRQLFANFSEAAERLSGPVGIVAVGAEVARTNAAGLFQFAAIVNLNLAIVNILPLPALDGGFLLLLLIEGIRGGKKIPQDVERAIMSSGLLLLLTAGVFLIVRDTINLAAFL